MQSFNFIVFNQLSLTIFTCQTAAASGDLSEPHSTSVSHGNLEMVESVYRAMIYIYIYYTYREAFTYVYMYIIYIYIII